MTAVPLDAARPLSLQPIKRAIPVNTATHPRPVIDVRNVRLPLSLTASVAIHVLVITTLAILLRAMPATVGNEPRSASVLSADIIALPPMVIEAAVPLPKLDPVEPIRPMLPTPVVPPWRNTPSPGISTTPATVQTIAEFVPVGRISYGIGDGKRLFGAGLGAQMASRFSLAPQRAARLDGSLSVLYPTKGAMKGRSQTLSALLSIDEHGRVSEARVLPEDDVFVAAVLHSLAHARFYPAQLDGKPIAYWIVLDFNFRIDGPTGPDGKRLDR